MKNGFLITTICSIFVFCTVFYPVAAAHSDSAPRIAFRPPIPGIPVPPPPRRIRPPVPRLPPPPRHVRPPVPHMRPPVPHVRPPVPVPYRHPRVGAPVFVPPPPRAVHRSLPADVMSMHIAGALFFYHLGHYYRQTDEGYVTVTAPTGARINALPAGCSSLHVGGYLYFQCDNVYYEPVDQGFVVVNAPVVREEVYEATAIAGDRVKIKAKVLNVRSGPGRRYEVIDQLYRGQAVEVGGRDGEWYYVVLGEGSYGWIMSKFTKIKRGNHDKKKHKNYDNSKG